MKSLLKYLKDYKKECVLGPLFKLLEALFDLTVPLVTAAIIDQGIGKQDQNQIFRFGGILVLLAVIGLICSITAQFFAAKAAVGFAAKLRYALFSHIESLSFAEIDEIGTSTLITRMTSDINQLQSGVNMALRLFLRSPFIVFGAMIMAFTIDVQAALIFLVAIPLLALVIFGIMAISTPLYKKVQEILDQVLGSTRENLTGVRVIRAFHREQEEQEAYNKQNDLLAKRQLFVGRIAALTNPLTYVMINIALVVLLWISGIRIQVGSLQQGQVVALINYLSQILVELVKLANTIILTNKSLASAERIADVMKAKSSLEEVSYMDIMAEEMQSANIMIENSKEKNVVGGIFPDQDISQEKRGQVIFEQVSMRYKNASEESISNVSFVAEAGETIGIIGGTGSGKSTLVNLIPRFYDVTSGRILVDGIDVRMQQIETLRSKIGIVLQKAVLFKGTIKENLLWGNENATDEEIKEALELSQAMEFVKAKEKGVDSVVAQSGRNLSGGQKQRLTIARALIRKPEILIFDDSTSALDYITDAKLREGLKNLSYHPTIFMVSQRTSSIRHADKIIVLEDGKVSDIGKHEELLERCKVYQEIHESQSKVIEDSVKNTSNDAKNASKKY